MSRMSRGALRVCSWCKEQTTKDDLRCHACGHWELDNTQVGKSTVLLSEYRKTKGKDKPVPRIKTGKWDGALGGGLVRGNTILTGGGAGAGKSTLALQIAERFPDQPAYYVAAEESVDAIDLRVKRLGITADLRVYPFLENGGGDFDSELYAYKPGLVIVDSLQKITKDDREQLALCESLKRYAVRNKACVYIVSHVNKDMVLSGAYSLQHEVDLLLCLFANEDKTCELYAIKSRQGPTFDILYFAMTDKGLVFIPPKKEEKKS